MNFKYFIIAIYLLFVALILTMVFKSCGQNIELETKDYYAKELRYQGEIDAIGKGNLYKDSFSVFRNGNTLKIMNPSSLLADSFRLEFIKPDRAASDRNMIFIGPGIPDLDISNFDEGVYSLKIRAYNNSGAFLIVKQIKL